MENIIKFLKSGGVEALILSILVLFFTALIKIPIKKYAAKRVIPEKITRFIPIIPFVLGGLLSMTIVGWKQGTVALNEEFFDLWLSSSGLSIAFYSCYENFRDSGNVKFEDVFQKAVYGLLKEKLGKETATTLKQLTEMAAEKFRQEKNGQSSIDFYEEMQKLLKNYVDTTEAGAIAKQVEEIWAELYGNSSYTEEVETVACTATEKYEYEVRKSHSVKKDNTEENEVKEEIK